MHRVRLGMIIVAGLTTAAYNFDMLNVCAQQMGIAEAALFNTSLCYIYIMQIRRR